MNIFDRRYEMMARPELEQLQLERLQALLVRLKRHVRRYRESLADRRVEALPELERLPLTSPEDLAAGFPYGMFALPLREVIRLCSVVGPEGKPLVLGHTRNDQSQWGRLVARQLVACGITANDVIQVSLGGAGAGASGGYLLGAEVIEAPTIRVEPPEDLGPLREAVGQLELYNWIVFTSVNAVDAFFAALGAAGLDSRALARTKLCSIGPATADRLAAFGLRPDAQPPQYTTDSIADAIAAVSPLAGAKVFYPRSDIAPPKLAADLAARGASVADAVAYRTVPEQHDAQHAADLFDEGGVHWVTFTSSSTVTNFLALVGPEKLKALGTRLASIGPSTSETLRQAGLTPTVEAEVHTIPGLVSAILAVENTPRGNA